MPHRHPGPLNSVSAIKTHKQGSRITPGTRIRFIGPNDKVVSDTIREIFWQQTLSQKGIALILTTHSWIWTQDVIDIEP